MSYQDEQSNLQRQLALLLFGKIRLLSHFLNINVWRYQTQITFWKVFIVYFILKWDF